MLRMLEQPRTLMRRYRPEPEPSPLAAIGAGLAGAVALTLVHETARRVIPHAPRVDVIGVRAIARLPRCGDGRDAAATPMSCSSRL